jgi:fucose 4-O-acetylase-like acetyltransferase
MRNRRNLSVDALKLVAVFGVIIIGLAPSTEAAEALTRFFFGFAVPFFLLISLHFFIGRVNELPSTCLLGHLRFDRILVPYAVWSVVYASMRWVKYKIDGQSPSFDPIHIALFGGAGSHLYFLPLLLLFQTATLGVLLLRRENKDRFIGTAIIVGALIFGYIGDSGDYSGFEDGLAGAAIYVALAFVLSGMQATALGCRINLILGILLTALLVLVAAGRPPLRLGIFEGPLFGYGAAALALNFRFRPLAPTARWLLTCSYGVYLTHFAFVEAFKFLATRLGYNFTPYTIPSKIIIGAFLFFCCIVSVRLIRSYTLTAYLCFGESENPLQRTAAGGAKQVFSTLLPTLAKASK